MASSTQASVNSRLPLGMLSTGGGGAFDPSKLPNIAAWFKADGLAGADGSTVGTWPDLSGNANDATTSGGTLKYNAINGKKSVVFNNGPAKHFTTPIVGNTYSVFTVFKHYTGNQFDLLWGASGDDMLYNFGNIQAVPILGLFPAVVEAEWHANGTFADLRLFAQDTWGAVGLLRATTDFSYTLNGEQSCAPATASIFGTANQTFGAIGGSTFNAAFHGEVAEHIICTSKLSSDNQAKLQTYFAAQYGTIRRPLIMCTGDSIPYGVAFGGNSFDPYPNQMQTAYGAFNVEVVNACYPGRTWVDMATGFPTEVAPFYSATRPKNLVVAMEGTNMMDGFTSAQVETAITTYVALCNAAHYKVILVTTIAGNNYGGNNVADANRIATNAWILTTGAALPGVVGTVNTELIPQLAGVAWSDSTYYNTDGIHPKTPGYTLLYTAVKAAIDAL